MSVWLSIGALAAYFGIMALLSRLSARPGGDFYRGGGRASGAVVAFAMLGAAISGVTFVSVPGMAAGKGWSYLQMALGFVVGYWVIARMLIPLFFRRGLVSIYGYLDERFGAGASRCGAWLFAVSKLTGAGVRFLVVCLVLQALVFAPMGLPFEVAVAVSVLLIWLYTRTSGVGAVLWADLLRSGLLIGSVVLTLVVVGNALGAEQVKESVKGGLGSIFYFSDAASPLYFWKQFIAGIFMAVAMTGLDQDMMQRTLASKDVSGASRGMIRGGLMQIVIIACFLAAGTLMAAYVEQTPGLGMPERTDDLFAAVATSPQMPGILAVVFLLGLLAAGYSAAASALTSLTTSVTIDILGHDAQTSGAVRGRVHALMGVLMGVFIILFYHLSSQDAISAVYTLASYTYGPLLGLFAFGMMCRRRVATSLLPVICVAAPVVCLVIHLWLHFSGLYEMGFELLLLNAALTLLFLTLASRPVVAAEIEPTI